MLPNKNFSLTFAISLFLLMLFPVMVPDTQAQDASDRTLQERALLAFQTVKGGPGTNFGATLVLNGDTVAVGASGEDTAINFDTGAVYVYTRVGFNWVQQQVLQSPVNTSGLFFGEALALDDNTLAVSSYYQDDSAGAVYLYTRAAGVWTLQATLTANDRAAGDLFGVALALDGNTLAVSAPGADTTAGTDSGAVYIFTRTGSTWAQQAKLVTNSPASGAGRSLALEAGTLLIGDPEATVGAMARAGRVMVYTGGGATWTPRAIVTASAPQATARFGYSLSYFGGASGGQVAVGAPGLATGEDSGAVYLFAGSGASWTQVVHLTPNTPQAGQTFGEEVGWNGQRLLVGAPNYDAGTLQSSGAVYVFAMIGSTWVQSQFVTGNDAATGGYFGSGLAAGPDWSVIGSSGMVNSVTFYRQVSSGQELLINGGFELGDSADVKVPMGWTQKHASNDKRKCTQARATYQGACVYKFASREGERSKLMQEIDPTQFTLNIGDTLVLDGFVNAKGSHVMTQVKAVAYYPDGSREKAIAKIRQPTTGYASLGTFSSKLKFTLTQVPTSIKVLVKNRGTSGKVLYDGLSLYIPNAVNAGVEGLVPLP